MRASAEGVRYRSSSSISHVQFIDFYQQFAPEVYRFAFWLSGDPTEAEDITSETFVRAWAASDDLRLGTVKSYLFTIARNLFLQGHRKTRRLIVIDPGLPDPARGPADVSEDRAEIREVLGALQELPEIDRAALIMRVQDELPYEVIAQALGISVAAARVKVHRARPKLAMRREGQGTQGR